MNSLAAAAVAIVQSGSVWLKSLDQHDALATSHNHGASMRQQKALVRRVRVALTVLGVDFPHDLDEAPQTSPR